jgi:hypothetical protein
VAVENRFTSRAGFVLTWSFSSPHENTARISLTRLLAASGSSALRSRSTLIAFAVMRFGGKSAKVDARNFPAPTGQ